MKYRLLESKRVIAVIDEGATNVDQLIETDVKKMSFYRSNKPPVIGIGAWPGIALWKVKVLFTTDVEKDINYKTERAEN